VTHMIKKMHTKFYFVNLKKRDCLGDEGIDMHMTFKWILKKR
jgi:hypothetical protein